MNQTKREFSYSLEKYRGPHTRYTCPSCGKKGEFVRYVDANGNYFGEDIGRCNRVIKCGYHKKPSGVVRQISDNVDLSDIGYARIDVAYYSMYPTDENIVLMPLFKRFGVTLDDMKAYGVTRDIHYYDGVVYWEKIDDKTIQGGVRIRYNPKTMKRYKDKQAKYLNKMYGAEYKRKYPFGYSCIDMMREAVCVVESQKTAVVMNRVIDKYSWVASCGYAIKNIVETLKSTIEKDIILVPDVGAEAYWAKAAKEYGLYMYRIRGKNNDDVLDYYIAGGNIRL